jgi:DNA helicase II / ATP-dependent DNA helicase PcrA
MPLLDDLNPRQREAVTASEGPLLVLAGAGTGKTRVITYRIAHLVENGIAGDSILAVTFTNKAAAQMKERASALLSRSGKSWSDPWISTFHSFCARMLRREAPRLGLRRDFAIYDDDDQTAAVKLALKNIGGAETGESVRPFLEQISFAKNQGLTPAQAAQEARDDNSRRIARVYQAYDSILKQSGALDFDDLLLRAVHVLRDFDEARRSWTGRFAHILVDEYQDTNRVQYDLLHLLAGERRNLCVVGDEDQSIYSWRGADVDNILRFSEDFPGAQIVRLEENYRSTQSILDAAAGVVSHNTKRLGKSLRATRGAGTSLRYFEARDAAAEADFIAQDIFRLEREDPSAHIAVLYRTNFQSRAFEESFRRAGIHYRVVGGFSFYQRAEIKDALAYVRLAMNPDDNIALLRVLNTPPRGIGQKSADSLRVLAQQRGGSLWSALAATIDSGASGRAVAPLKDFRDLIKTLASEAASLPAADFLRAVLERTGYLEMLAQREGSEEIARTENLHELVNALAEATERGETLSDFLDQAALVSDADEFDERSAITLMTLHSAKGLEFDHVFLTGLEEGLFPHSRSRSPDELEEERRLCYVGMTRARDTLTLTRAVYRRIYGSERLDASAPSRFLAEIPGELIDTAEGSLAEAGATRRYEPDPEYSFSQEDFHRRSRRATSSEPHRSAPRGSSPRTPRAPRPGANPLVGVRVRHPTYGLGTIISVDDDDDDRKLTVSFLDHGTKKLLERYANLERA